MFHELYLVSSLLCIAQNVRFKIPYKVLYFETPFLIIFKYYAWASYVDTSQWLIGLPCQNRSALISIFQNDVTSHTNSEAHFL